MQVNTFQYTCHGCRFKHGNKGNAIFTDPMNALEHTLKHGDYCDTTHPQYLAILGKLEEIILNTQKEEYQMKEMSLGLKWGTEVT